MTTWRAPADDQPAGAQSDAGNIRTTSLNDHGQPTVADVAAARLWLGELFGDLHRGGIWVGLRRPTDGRWWELGPVAPGTVGVLPVPSLPDVLDALALELVRRAYWSKVDVFVSPYPHRLARREKGGARLRRHVHADIDGRIDLGKANMLGALVVASGGLADDGSPRGHVYVRLAQPVDAALHTALCRRLAWFVGGDAADLSKTADNDVLRPPGTLSWKSTPPRPVTWLVRPDAERVHPGWPVADLARLLAPYAPPAPPRPAPAPARHGAAGAGSATDVRRRLDGLVRSVAGAGVGGRNSKLNWAAGVAAAVCATEPAAPPAAEIRTELVDAFLSVARIGESPSARRREAEATVQSAWKYGTTRPSEALNRQEAGR